VVNTTKTKQNVNGNTPDNVRIHLFHISLNSEIQTYIREHKIGTYLDSYFSGSLEDKNYNETAQLLFFPVKHFWEYMGI
jgi:hypothetical protein